MSVHTITDTNSYVEVSEKYEGKKRPMRQDQAIRIYQGAVDPTMGVEQGTQWWAEVSAELEAVIAATDSAAAAGIIAWWHHDWSMVGQTPKRVAGRIRRQAARVLNS